MSLFRLLYFGQVYTIPTGLKIVLLMFVSPYLVRAELIITSVSPYNTYQSVDNAILVHIFIIYVACQPAICKFFHILVFLLMFNNILSSISIRNRKDKRLQMKNFLNESVLLNCQSHRYVNANYLSRAEQFYNL